MRERDEWEEATSPAPCTSLRLPGRGRIEHAAFPIAQPIVVYCAGGSRSASLPARLKSSATRTSLSRRRVHRLEGNGFPFELPQTLDEAKRRCYSRHLLIPEVGEEGQQKLLDSRVLLIGAGGLGSPAGLYLAAAGIGTIGIVDDDAADETNLQRQIVHSTERLGDSKAESAKRTIEALNPDVTAKVFKERSPRRTPDRSSARAGTSSSTAPTTSRRATS